MTLAFIGRYWLLLVIGVLAWSAMAAFFVAHRRSGLWATAAGLALGACSVLLLADGASSEQPIEVAPQPGPNHECRSGGDNSDCPGG